MMAFKQAQWNEPLIIDRSREGVVGFSLSSHENLPPDVPVELLRKKRPKLPEVSETDVIRHYLRLSQENYGVDLGIYPLGSCTMKYNPKLLDRIAASSKMQDLHPLQDVGSAQGILRILHQLSEWLAEIVGLDKVSLQPAAGAQGEFAGAMIMRAFHKQNGNLEKRDEIIIPDSAHGTNPASATMAGFKVVEIPSNKEGCVDIDALRVSLSHRTAGLMLTNPNTLGIFEADILEIAKLVHEAGGLLYYDGANLNAMLGKAKPGQMGFDIVHINIHKTFATPHGGGGPGSGPIAVSKKLEEFLPVPTVERDGDRYYLDSNRPNSIGKIRAFWGNSSVLLRAYAYILMMGRDGLEEVAEISVLNANYLARKLSQVRGLELPFPHKVRKHEFVLSAAKMARETGITAAHLSKRLLDFGVHAPTIYFPLIVDEAMMIEPTETVSKQELDEFIVAFSKASTEAYTNPDIARDSPKSTSVTRIDEARASHPKTMQLTWKEKTRAGRET
jgi:glycine dehydrogenase subunit 2